jgi:prepilin-type N-terminal cleavage/methylation domain-containing protein
MIKIKPIRRSGLTLIELMVAAALAVICMLAVGLVFSDSQKAWNRTYTKANSAVMLDSHMASKAFEATVRKATCERYLLDPPDANNESHWVEVYYFASDSSETTDRYAKLYVEDGTFKIEHGVFNPENNPATTESYTTEICSNVTNFNFSGSGRCIRLEMTLSEGNDSVTFISSAIPQNQ